jgi:hypothetical protein
MKIAVLGTPTKSKLRRYGQRISHRSHSGTERIMENLCDFLKVFVFLCDSVTAVAILFVPFSCALI